MPTTFLDLSDDIIDRISYFVHRDYDVPIPSFNPHWANFVTELDRGLATDYLALRATCKRIRDICQLKGLHLFLRSWQRVLEWMADAPDSVVKGIRRLELDIEARYWPPELKKLDDNALISDIYGYGKYPLIPTWSTITSLLSRFESLEELYLGHSPLCQHKSNYTTTNQLKPPSINFLPQLKSISFEIQCKFCSYEIPKLIIPCCPSLKHLKMTNLSDSENETPQDNDDFGEDFKSVIDLWLDNHNFAGGVDNDKERKCNLETLVMKIWEDSTITKKLKLISSQCPNLKKLHLIKTDRHELTPGFFLGGQYSKHQDRNTVSKDDWIFKHFGNEWITGLYDDIRNIKSWPEDKTWDDFLEALGKFQKLESFDFIINPHIDIDWPSNVIPHEEEKASDYDKYQNRMKNNLEKYGITNPRLAESMKSAVRIMLQKTPTLKNGYFWQFPYDWNNEPAHIWRRWSWFVIPSNVNTKGKEFTIKIDPLPQLFASEWMKNKDGQSGPDYDDLDLDED
ncbi:uncharacterized protein L201_006693 [Kwoniella dendrophila CBS 6074]|uniref:F-box domain-containing protein n=1 Tax=Kwoniella dendrophila CBS 6074 TaxID=1295534 RepID=A0AAX4K2E1_9TREE